MSDLWSVLYFKCVCTLLHSVSLVMTMAPFLMQKIWKLFKKLLRKQCKQNISSIYSPYVRIYTEFIGHQYVSLLQKWIPICTLICSKKFWFNLCMKLQFFKHRYMCQVTLDLKNRKWKLLTDHL